VGNARLADAIDALPRELAVWHDDPAALAKLLTHCTLKRLAEEAELLRSGIGPGLSHPDAEFEDPAYSDHRDRWSHAVSTIVDWHGRLMPHRVFSRADPGTAPQHVAQRRQAPPALAAPSRQ
jgi:hypothetical protein